MTKKFLSFELNSLLRKSSTLPPISTNVLIERALRSEERTLALSGLHPNKDITIFDVAIKYDGFHNMHTIHCGHHNNEILVLLHGYCGSSALFYPILKDLSQRFQVYCVDLLGLGLSSRPDFTCNTTQESLDYYVDSLEEWRKALNLEKFSIGGHSFGGYLSAQYARKYSDNVEGLYLFSPTGLSLNEEPRTINEWANMSWSKKQFWYWYFHVYSKYFWTGKLTPPELVRRYPITGKLAIKSYIHTLFRTSLSEADRVSQCLFDMYMIPGGSEKSIHSLLKPPRMGAFMPLEEVIAEQLRIPVHCYYGVEDWVDCTGANNLMRNPKNKHFKVQWISKCGHQMIMQNPKEVTKAVLNT